ncbi:PNOC protein, partial [Polypterus senegalus]
MELQRKNELYKAYETNNSKVNHWAYENMRAIIKKDIKETERLLERTIASKGKDDPKRFFQYSFSKRTVKEEVTCIRNSKGELKDTDSEIVDTLNLHFSEVFTSEEVDNLPLVNGTTKEVCIDECERRVATTLIWDACDKAIVNSLTQDQDGGLLRLESEEITLPKGWKDGTIYTTLLKHLTNVVKASGGSPREEDQKMSQTPKDYLEEQDVQESSNSNGENYDIFLGNHNLSKRFGGFLKGKYGYKKLLYPGKSLYKRYGGFIGVRKSARKWNNQKRFSEFLKQFQCLTPEDGVSGHFMEAGPEGEECWEGAVVQDGIDDVNSSGRRKGRSNIVRAVLGGSLMAAVRLFF